MSGDGEVHIEIDRLVIDAAAGCDERELVRVIEAELSRLFARGAPEAARSGGRLDLADRSLTLPAGASTREIGRRVARTIWRAGSSEPEMEEKR